MASPTEMSASERATAMRRAARRFRRRCFVVMALDIATLALAHRDLALPHHGVGGSAAAAVEVGCSAALLLLASAAFVACCRLHPERLAESLQKDGAGAGAPGAASAETPGTPATPTRAQRVLESDDPAEMLAE